MKKGYYYNENRCYFLTGSKKGNKWIDLEDLDPEWVSLLWTCLPKEEELSEFNYKYSSLNPTKFI